MTRTTRTTRTTAPTAANATDATDATTSTNPAAAADATTSTNPAAVVQFYDAQGVMQGKIETKPVTVARLRAHAANDSGIAASLLFRSLVDSKLTEAVIADGKTWTTTLKKGSALSDLVGSKTLAGQLAPILVWYLQHPGDLYAHWTTRDAERQSRPTIGGVSAYASGLISGAAKRKTTAADVIQQLVVMIQQRISALEELPDEPRAVQVRARVLEVLAGDCFADEERKIYKRALKPRKE